MHSNYFIKLDVNVEQLSNVEPDALYAYFEVSCSVGLHQLKQLRKFCCKQNSSHLNST